MFGPPEVITGRLMSGAGAGPMLAASGEFTAAALAYEASADRLLAQMVYLMANWQGPTAMALQRAVTRFLAWMRVLQSQLVMSATRTANQAAAFTTAYTTMAQMAEIVENRVTTAILHATNFLGMNAIPIGIKEGQYLEMWMRDVAVQTNYLAETVANTTHEPFVPAVPLTGITTFPPVITQAINAAMAAGDKVRLHADMAENIARELKGRLGITAGLVGQMAMRGKDGAEQAEAQAAMARFREQQGQQPADKMTQQMTQQLVQQVPQQAASLGQQAVQMPQQAMQQVQQGAQQLTGQFSSQISSLMSQVAPEHRLDNPGFFDTHPSSTTLDRLAGSSGSAPMTAALRVPNLSGLSGVSTGFRFPSGWDGAVAGAAPPPPPAGGMNPAAAARPMGSGMPLHGLARRTDAETAAVKRPDTELIPVWGEQPGDSDTVTAGEFAELAQAAQQETAR